MEKTAVEWLAKEINKENGVLTKGFINILIQQAKEMEKKQIIDAYNEAIWERKQNEGEQYYKATFKKD